ncbi:hypothetical protein PMI42_06867 [Bradyrhizobium sp. YR681]|uniref:hypothetical protein n=1 Tax=Bradyrhizobium sp. YR681 TaxID=1144344 RepID=UPI00026F8F14|nr:hypothetical protein [Bradyrhizobium sp. YR681]EJN09256.1 hypothetical protein PMI42_06867 [Bradyrhizobium sp. YR681]
MAVDQIGDPQPKSSDRASIAIALVLAPLGLFVFWAGNNFMVEFVAGWIDRPWLSDFVQNHFVLANFIYLAISYAIALPTLFFAQLQEKTGRSIFLVPTVAFALPFAATIFAGYYRAYVIVANVVTPAFYGFVAEYGLKIPLFLFVVFGAPALSYLAYRVRGSNQTLYGSIELVFGIGFILFSVYSVALAPFLAAEFRNPDVWKTIFSFFTGVYIIVRGLVNIEDGLGRGTLTGIVILGFLSQLLARLPGQSLFSTASGGQVTDRQGHDEEETG